MGFSYTIHLINAVGISLVTARLLKDNTDLSDFSRGLAIAATGLIQVANLSYFDRPEETALILVWLEMLLVWNPSATRIFPRALFSGVLIGSSALIAPWVGLLGALTITFRSMIEAGQQKFAKQPNWKSPVFSLVMTGITAALLAGAWYVWINHHYPGVVRDQFEVISNYIKNDQMMGTALDRPGEFLRTMLFNRFQLLATMLTLLFYPMFVVGRGWRQTNCLSIAIYLAAATTIIFCGITRPSAYTYLGASQMLLLPCFGPAVSRYLTGKSAASLRFGIAIVSFCVLFSFGDAARLGIRSLRLPERERPRAAFDRLREIVPADARVSATSRHWYAFQGRNQWIEAFWCSFSDPPETLKCEWLVLYPGMGMPDFIDAFTLVEELPNTASGDETYAWSLWRLKTESE